MGRGKMDVEDVAADLAKHEAICAERWKTAFRRFDDLDSQVNRIETIMIGVSGAIICGGAAIIWTMLSMHS